MKICLKCKQVKTIYEFHKDRSKKDRLQIYCISCRKKYQQSLKGKATSCKSNRKYQKTKKGKIADKHSKSFHLNQVKARSAVKYAVESGRLARVNILLCRCCPKQAQQYHHWHGYEPEHWLDVIPICMDCHSKCGHKVA